MLGGGGGAVGAGAEKWEQRQREADEIIRALGGKRARLPKREFRVPEDEADEGIGLGLIASPAVPKVDQTKALESTGAREIAQDDDDGREIPGWWERLAERSVAGDLLGRSIGAPEPVVIQALKLSPEVVEALRKLGNRSGVSMQNGVAVYWLDDTTVPLSAIFDALAGITAYSRPTNGCVSVS